MTKKIWIIKIGSALITNNGKGIDKIAISDWVRQIVELKKQNIDIILVSSGAIAEGMNRLNWKIRPTEIEKLQAAAAVGQMGLIQIYESAFSKYNYHTAQVLLTHNDIKSNSNIKIKNTLKTLLEVNTIPIINENDTVDTDEICFGDNDTLASEIALLLNANKLIILTDQEGLYNKDPRDNKDAKLIKKININDEQLQTFATKSKGGLGSGGMFSKISAAKQAATKEINTHIAYGLNKDVLLNLETLGTIIYC
ncbi:Glutamate 5-kinase / RNA-binding C-terminal domain PUA [hydrothermal vent metagenome]|uniref:Glutamate 5-kinase / RNA-binding C-terminal domain PUA n=1 Tax=hydrothermal vent metagenome TaxID=652676 RepID=A0A1W1C300_9ZZZZ